MPGNRRINFSDKRREILYFVEQRLHQLHELGVQLVIDDFGTGFSPMTYLKRLKADILKIDKTFIDMLPDDEIDQAIIDNI